MAERKNPKTGKRAPKRALCVGINDYPYDGSDLNGCVNDAKAWAELLTGHFGFAATDVKLLLDKDATRNNILNSLEDLLAEAKPGDTLVFTNSSHGSYVVNKDGDEDAYDEVLCPYDIQDNHIVDDDLRKRIARLPDGVKLTIILDNCFSGTATRAPLFDIIPGLRTPDDRRIRFLSPALRGLPVLENPWRAKPSTRIRYPESSMKEVLLSGCTDKEYSYDAFFGGKYHGAMTYYSISAIQQSDYKLTYSQLHSRLCHLICDYPQHPQLEGKKENKRLQIFD